MPAGEEKKQGHLMGEAAEGLQGSQCGPGRQMFLLISVHQAHLDTLQSNIISASF